MTFFRKKTKHWDWRMTSSSSITEITQSSPQLPLISWTRGNYDYYSIYYISYQYHNMREVFITKHGRVDVWHSDNKTNKQHRTVYQLPDSVSMFVGRIWSKLSPNWLSVEYKIIFPDDDIDKLIAIINNWCKIKLDLESDIIW